MKLLLNRIIIIIFSMLLLSSSIISFGYSHWDNNNIVASESVPLGIWTYVPLPIGLDFTADLNEYMDYKNSQNPNTNYNYIYSQIDVPNNLIKKIRNIDLFGSTWTFWGKGKTANYPTIGYPVLIDRTLDSFGNPVHDIAPEYSVVPLYTDYDYFIAYDSNNLHTNSNYSLRLNYNTRMTSKTSLGQVTNISFYAAIGLADPDDGANIRDTQKMYVEVSATNSNWTKLGTNPIVPQVNSDNEYFTFYSFDVPGTLLGQDLYVRIRYNGRALQVNGSAAFARLIIDELVITTN